MATPKFINTNNTFQQELKKRVNQYFVENNKSSTGNFSLFFKAIFFFASYLALYVHLVYFTPTAWLAVLECILMGGFTAAIGFNVMHDGGHGSFSKNKLVNKLAAMKELVFGLLVIIFLIFEPSGMAARWHSIKNYWKLYPFSR